MDTRWKTLLCDETFTPRSETIDADGRNPFENDYGRLISSAPIRRLQDKTQVFPLEQSDYTRTRLTHSLEVSYIGSSIGTSIERALRENKELDDGKYLGYISSLLRVTGLVHDIGNPPFGHFGEEAIQDFFSNFFQKNSYTCLNDQEKADFIYFDGNVQTFRILRKLYWFKNKYSFNLTYPLFATTVKYPSNSIEGNKKGEAQEIRLKKFGYYISDQAEYQKINKALNLNNKRHPLVFLMEAADDIAYCAADIEDGVKLGAIDYETVHRAMEENLKTNRDLIENFDDIYKCTDVSIGNRLTIAIQQLRVKAQSKMIECVIATFLSNYNQIMDGNFQEELLFAGSASDIRRTFKELGKIVYTDKKIIQTELAGWEAIQGLLSIFVPAILRHKNGIDDRLYRNISSSYRFIYEKYAKESHSNDQYNRIQLVVDFISGMTDSYAISLYQKLKGIKL